MADRSGRNLETGIDGFDVVTSHPRLLAYVDHLQRKNAESLSFYPLCTFEREAEKYRIFVGILNDDPCGYLYCGAYKRTLKIHQVCIQYDTRRKLYGASLVAVVERCAIDRQCDRVRLRCGFDLDANRFWADLGYHCVRVESGGVRRMRKINVWEKWLQPTLFEPETTDPAVGKTSAALWRKTKTAGVVNQFSRGQRLRDYRELLEEKERAGSACE